MISPRSFIEDGIKESNSIPSTRMVEYLAERSFIKANFKPKNATKKKKKRKR